MKRKRVFGGLAVCLTALVVQAGSVFRFVPVEGADSEVERASLRKIVFTQDSMLLVSTDNSVTEYYKYDYLRVDFPEYMDDAPVFVPASAPQGGKYLQNGRLFIRRDNCVYDCTGRLIQTKP